MDELQKITALRKRGFDPSRFDVDPDGTIVEYDQPIRNITPTVSEQPQASSTALGSFGRSAKRAAIPAGAGLLTTGAILSSTGVGLLPGLLAMGGGLGASLLAGKAQDAIAPLDEQEIAQLHADTAQHPYAQIGGEIAPSLLALKPTNPIGLVKNLGQAARGVEIGIPARNALKLAGVNAAISGGVDSVMQLAQNGDIDAARLVASTLTGALLNEPTKLGKKIGLPSSVIDVPAEVTPEPITGEQRLAQEKAKPQPEQPQARFRVDESGKTLDKRPEEIIQPEVVTNQRTRDYNLAREELRSGGNETEVKPAATTYDILGKSIVENKQVEVPTVSTDLRQLNKRMKGNAIGEETPTPEAIADKVLGEEGPMFSKNADNTVKMGDAARENEVKPLSEAERIQEEYDRGVRYQDESQLDKLHNELDKSGVAPENYRNVTVKDFLDLAAKRNVTGEVGKITTPQGKEAAGVSIYQDRLAKINPDAPKFNIDTPLHEIGHIHLQDLAEHGTAFEKRLVSEGEKLAGSHEKLVDAVGRKSVERNNPLGEWLGDFWSHVKARFGGANEKDITRLLSRKLLDDAAFTETHLARGEMGKNLTRIKELEGKLATAPEGERGVISDEMSRLNSRVDAVMGDEKFKHALYQEGSKLPREKETTPDTSNKDQKEGFLSVLEPMTAKVRHLDKGLGDSLDERARLQVRLTGRFANTYQLEAAKGNWNKADFDTVNRYRWEQWHREPNTVKLNESQMKLNELFEAQSHDVRDFQNSVGLKIKDGEEYRAGHKSTDYHPSIVGKNVQSVLRSGLNNPKREEYINQIADWWLKQSQATNKPYTKEEALRDAHEYATALGGSRSMSNEQKFNALRRAKGMGLPWELIEKDGMSLLQRYGQRAARDMSFFMAVEKNDRIRSMLNLPDQFGSKSGNIAGLKDYSGTQEVQDVLRFFADVKPEREQVLNSVGRVITANFLGPVSAMRDIIGSYAQMLPYMRPQDTQVFLTSLGRLEEGWKNSFKTGVNRSNIQDIEFGPSAVNSVVEKFNKAANLIAKYQGRNIGEQFSRANTFTIGESLAIANYGRAKSGDIQSIQWLEHFGKGNKRSVEEIINKGPTKEELNEMAAAFVEKVQGTYDERGLPAFATQGTLMPFFSLAKWSIEKSNTIYKDVVQPILSGDKGSIERLLTYTLGSVMAGEAIHALADAMNNKLSYDTSLSEVRKSEFSKPEDYVASVVNMMQLAGSSGIVMDLVKTAIDTSKGRPSQGYNLPLAQFVGDNVIGVVRDWSNATDAGQPVFDSTQQAIVDILRNTTQSARIAYNWMNQEETSQKNLRRDLRVYKEFTDQPTGEMSATRGPDIVGKQTREFKQTTDMAKTLELMPDVLQQAVSKSQSPQDLKANISSLRSMPVSEFPSLESNPVEFGQFVQFLNQKYGLEQTKSLVEYYQKRVASQKAKKDLLPKP